MKICFSETPNNAPALVVGYRSGKVVVCTRSERDIRQKSGTGEEKWLSAPDLSRKSDGNRVQEKEKCNLYPCGARCVVGEESAYRYRMWALET